ncbi:MAG: hypothetical protein IBJ11_11435 [Phycisphaerales bacterium]|nr:hypothetical protein [Phycisphaerales bacterium]
MTDTPSPRPRPNGFRGLIALNAVLLTALAGVTFIHDASAQPRQNPPAGASPPRSRGEYAMVSGRVQGVPESAIFVVDQSNQEVLALRWDRSTRQVRGIGYRDMKADGARGQQGGR